MTTPTTPPVPPIEPGVLRIVPLGGFEEVGRSMTVFEYEDDILLFDMGLQWTDRSYGVDYLIPDISYLADKKHKIRGVVISHGHYDHIGGIPHIMPALGLQIPIYCLPMTAAMILKRQEEYAEKLNVQSIRDDEVIQAGKIRAEFVRVNHNIPDSMAIAVTTPRGTVVHSGDYKIDHSPVNEKPIDLPKFSRIGERGEVLAFLADATSAYMPGYQLSEAQIMKNLEPIFIQSEGRIIASTFASLLSRLQQLIWLSARVGRKVAIEGRSMRENAAIAQNLHYLQIPQGTLIDVKDISRYAPEQLTIIVTGAQGEDRAALSRIARGEHKSVQIEPGDTVILSSSVIPGNDPPINRLMDLLYRQKANVVHYRYVDIHAGGHAKAEETRVMLQLLKPRVLIPQHGTHAQGIMTIDMMSRMGYERGRNAYVIHDGAVFEFLADGTWRTRAERAPNRMVAVDGLGVGDVGDTVLKDREAMAADGVFVILVRHDAKGKLLSAPDLVSRGFVFVRGAEKLLAEARTFIQELWGKHQALAHTDPEALKQLLRTEVTTLLTQRTGRTPMIIPILVRV